MSNGRKIIARYWRWAIIPAVIFLLFGFVVLYDWWHVYSIPCELKPCWRVQE